MRKSTAVWLLAIFILLILAPIFVNFLMGETIINTKVYGTKSDWIAFFGNYSGGIIGGIITLIGLRITLDKDKKDKNGAIEEAIGLYKVAYRRVMRAAKTILDNQEKIRKDFGTVGSPYHKETIKHDFENELNLLRQLESYDRGLLTLSPALHYLASSTTEIAIRGCDILLEAIVADDVENVVEAAKLLEESVQELYNEFKGLGKIVME